MTAPAPADNEIEDVHDKGMAAEFVAVLDPGATRFTFQFFSDGAGKYAKVVHGSLDEVWPQVLANNTAGRGVGVFVTINETDFQGRSAEHILRPRALFVTQTRSINFSAVARLYGPPAPPQPWWCGPRPIVRTSIGVATTSRWRSSRRSRPL